MGFMKRVMSALGRSPPPPPPPPVVSPMDGMPTLPPFLTFVGSKYILVIIITAGLVNRIQSIVPSRTRSSYRNVVRMKWVTVLLRLPSLMFQIFTILKLLRIMEPILRFGKEPLGKWFTIPVDMIEEQVIWNIFLSSTIAVVSEAFVRSLSGDLSATGSYSLLTLGMMLHSNEMFQAASNSSTTAKRYLRTAFYLGILFNQLEFVILQISYLWSDKFRFIITGSASIVLQVYVYRAFASPTSVSPDGWHTRALDMVFEIFTITTVILRFLSTLLRFEPLTVEGIFGEQQFWPHLIDDYGAGIMRYGLSFWELGLSGLLNEVEPMISYVKISNGGGISIESKTKKEFSQSIQEKLGTASDNGELGIGREIVAVECIHEDFPNPVYPKTYPIFMKLVRLSSRVIKQFVGNCLTTGLKLIGLGRLSWQLENWKVIRGIDFDDEQDEDFSIGSNDGSDAGDRDSENDSDDQESLREEGEEEMEDDSNPNLLFSDLTQIPTTAHRNTPSESSPSSQRQSSVPIESTAVSTAILLAHHSSTTPLTRSRFKEMVSPFGGQKDGNGRGMQSRVEIRKEMEEFETKACAVCYCDERTIILWPCKCLCLCEGCREGMALRSRENLSCPCCRTKIDGFSRIFIP